MDALIAGTGALPPLLAERLRAGGGVPLICELEGFPSAVAADLPRMTFRIERIGTLLKVLADRGVTRVCIAGAVERPRLKPWHLDLRTLPLLPQVIGALAKGDDGALRTAIGIIESRGIEVVAATDIAPDLLPPAGVPTRARPTARHDIDARRGAAEVAEMGRADLGQACIVRTGAVIRREDARGTDYMLGLLAPPGPQGADARPALRAILFKAPKPGQDRRVDQPTIGVQTAINAVKAGLDGIVIEAGGVIVIDLAATVAALDAAGLFLWVRAGES
jgi:UDP-2,3-diacylglucosamine hydrolase